MKIATATLGFVVAFSASANAVEHGPHRNLKGGKSMIKSESVVTIDEPKSITLTGSYSSTETSLNSLFSKFAKAVASVQLADPANPNDPTAPGAKLVDVGQSCCGECWCIDEGVDCPLRTTAFPQLYTEGMVYDFGNKTLVNPDTLEVVPSKNLFVTGCNPYEGVSKHTNPPWKAYNGCELTPAQTFDTTSASGYDEAVCAFSYPKFNEDGNCDTYTYKTYASAEEAEDDGAYVTHHTQCGACSSGQDLAVYLKFPDLTTAGIKCGVDLKIHGLKACIDCYMNLGFTEACANVWAYDSEHTGKYGVCLGECLTHSNATGPPPQCALSDCVQCDDTKSGPTFNAYSGRTRRNSGIWSGLARSCSSIQKMQQNTCPLLYTVPDDPICQAQQICTVPNPLQQNQCE